MFSKHLEVVRHIVWLVVKSGLDEMINQLSHLDVVRMKGLLKITFILHVLLRIRTCSLSLSKTRDVDQRRASPSGSSKDSLSLISYIQSF